MFKIKDKVYDLKYGWGIVEDSSDHIYPIRVRFDNDYQEYYTINGCPTAIGTNRTLFFCEPKFENLDDMINRKEWSPINGENFYFVLSNGKVRDLHYSEVLHGDIVKVANCFKTEEEAKDSKFYKVFHGEE